MQPDPASAELPFGDLLIDDVFFDYGFPQLFSASGDAGRIVGMCMSEDEDADTAEFLYVQIDQPTYERYRHGELSLRDWIDETRPNAWIVTWRFGQDETSATADACDVSELPDSSLPERGATLGTLAKAPETSENLRSLCDELPAGVCTYLRQRKITTVTKRRPEELARDYLRHHGCCTVEQFHERAASRRQDDYALAARKENAKTNINIHAVETWLRLAEQTEDFARAARDFTYNEQGLRELLPRLRERCARPDDTLLTDVRELLESVGVLFVLMAPPTNVPLHGMTRWINRSVPVVLLTGRRKTDGFIIVTLFHELGHVLEDPRGETHLEFRTENSRQTTSEKNARKFAREWLFGPDGPEVFRGLSRDYEIRAKAREVGVSPGVAVWEMHRKTWLDRRFGNKLSVKFGDQIE